MNLNNSGKNLLFSLKKYFIDGLKTTDGVEVFFDRTYMEGHLAVPEKITQWVVFDLDASSSYGVLKHQMVYAYIHSRDDKEGDALSALEDSVMEYLEDMTQEDGLARIPLYNVGVSPWVQIGTMLVYQSTVSDTMYVEDGTKFKYINFMLKWAL